MRPLWIVAVLLLPACAYHSPNAPSPITAPAPIAARITLQGTVGIGATATQAFLTATVTDASGVHVPSAVVTFATSAGTLSRSSISTDAGGNATTTLTSATPATVTATTAGGLATSLSVATGSTLSVMLSLGPQVPTRSISVAVIALVPDAVLPATYDWSFGDGATMTTASSTTFHTYTSPGTVTVSVTVTDAAGHVGTATVTTTVADLPAVKPPPVTLPPSLSASVNCTVPGGTPPPPPPVSIPCNVTAAYGGVAVPSSFVTGVDWDWGDGAKNLGAGVALSHTYGQLGTFTVFATLAATTVDGPKGPVSALLVITIP